MSEKESDDEVYPAYDEEDSYLPPHPANSTQHHHRTVSVTPQEKRKAGGDVGEGTGHAAARAKQSAKQGAKRARKTPTGHSGSAQHQDRYDAGGYGQGGHGDVDPVYQELMFMS